MNLSFTQIRPQDVLSLLIRYRWRWLVPTVLCALLATGYAYFKPKTYEASQTLMLRNDALSAESAPGRFRNVDEMKITQETVLEMARSFAMMEQALRDVGPFDQAQDRPSSKSAPDGWPCADDVRDLQDRVRLAPPKGAEFGKTEIFYLLVQDNDAPRAVALSKAIAQRLLDGLNRVRDGRARSLIDEFQRTVGIADGDLKAASDRLAAMESQVGGRDLAELRMLDGAGTGDSDLRRLALALDDELRQVKTAARASEELLSLLKAAQKDERELMAAPNRLLESQPAIRKLKDGLVEAQLRLAQLQGSMTEAHPVIIDAKSNVSQVLTHLHHELSSAIRGLEVESRLSEDRRQSLEKQREDLAGRLNKLASMRAEYSSIVADVKHRTALAEEARRNLAAARALQVAANGARLLQVVDGPSVDDRPIGPRKYMIILGGLGAGLAIGLGLVFLSLPSAPKPAVAPAMSPVTSSQGESAVRHAKVVLSGSALDSTSVDAVQFGVPASVDVVDVWATAGGKTITGAGLHPSKELK